MENLGTYFLIALAIGWIIYYSNKKRAVLLRPKHLQNLELLLLQNLAQKSPASKKIVRPQKRKKKQLEHLHCSAPV
jgi:hypothetical protein